jgi:glycosyltransferase involved in cell wall biosynthesis
MSEPLLYLCDRTSYYNFNSGIQRVVRALARALLEIGVPLVPVALNGDNFELLNQNDLENLSNFYGPEVSSWGSRATQEKRFEVANTILIPELTPAYSRGRHSGDIVKLAKDNGLTSAYVFYDAVPWIFPQWYEYEMYFTNALGMLEADIIFPISFSAYSDLLTTVAIPNKKPVNKIVPLSLPTELVDDHTCKPKNNTSQVIKALTVSSMEHRKNHKLMLEALKDAQAILKGLGIELQVTFAAAVVNTHVLNDVRQLIDEVRVQILPNCSDEELRNQYQQADFTIYPSLYEGFGLPLVESFAFNTPVITSTGGSLGEVAEHGGCLTFEPTDKEMLVSHIVTMASKKFVRDELIEQIKTRPIKTWKEYAREIIDVIQPK